MNRMNRVSYRLPTPSQVGSVGEKQVPRHTIDFTCANCGKEVHREPRKLNPDQNLVFCNRECWREYRRQNPIKPTPQFFEAGRQMSAQAKRKPKTYICAQCGTEFQRVTKWPEHDQSFCSRECAFKAASPWARWKKGRERSSPSARQSMKRRFIDCCAICGWAETSCDVHHIIQTNTGGSNKFDNLIILCPNHHRLANKGLITIEELFEAWHNMKLLPGVPDKAVEE